MQTLGQIELCLTKDLQLRNCTEPGEPGEPGEPAGSWRGAWPARPTRSLEVCEDGPVFYPPPR